MLLEQGMSDAAVHRATAHGVVEDARVLTAGSALVVIIFAFVPFIGILFCPCAIVLGAVHLRRAPDARERRVAVFNIVCGILILSAHAFLWWVLYQMAK